MSVRALKARKEGVPLGLRAPVAVRGDLEVTEGVALRAVLLLLHGGEHWRIAGYLGSVPC